MDTWTRTNEKDSMIYLIKASALCEDEDGNEYQKLALKIGYTQDNSGRKRLAAYVTHTPGFKVLYILPDLGEDFEEFLHTEFEEYNISGDLVCSGYGESREWFEYDQRIIDYFAEIKEGKNLENVIMFSRFKKLVTTGHSKEGIKVVSLFAEWEDLVLNEDKVNFYIQNKSDPEIYSVVPKFYENLFDSAEGDVKTIVSALDCFDFINNSSFILSEKLKKYTEYECSDKIRSILLEQISDKEFRRYISGLSLNEIKSTNYDISQLDKLLEEKLKIAIYSEFKEGDSIPKSRIKSKLADIYIKTGCKKTAKANDLDKWFEIKATKAKNSTGKWVNAFELMKKKA